MTTRKQSAQRIAKALTMDAKSVGNALKSDSVAFEDYLLALEITIQRACEHYRTLYRVIEVKECGD